MQTTTHPIPYDLITKTVKRLNLDGLYAEARTFARRAYAQRTEADVRALVRGYYPED